MAGVPPRQGPENRVHQLHSGRCIQDKAAEDSFLDSRASVEMQEAELVLIVAHEEQAACGDVDTPRR